MNAKKSIVDKYYPIWEGGKSVERVNPKVGFCIRLYCINQMNAAFQKNKDLFSDEDREKMIKMITEFKETKAQISEEDQKCTLEDYQVFLDKFFTNLDYEDRHETVTLKTSNKFRLMAGFIDVLTTFGPLDDEMKKCKKYCAFKAIDIFKALKRGEVPKRGGPKEEENSKDKIAEDELGKEIENMSNKDDLKPSSTIDNQGLQQPPNNFAQNQMPNNVNNANPNPYSNPYANPYINQDPSLGVQPTPTQSNNPVQGNGGYSNPFSPQQPQQPFQQPQTPPQQPQIPPQQPQTPPQQPKVNPQPPKNEPKQPSNNEIKKVTKATEKLKLTSNIVKDKTNYNEPVGPRTTKVTQDKKNPNMKLFEMKYGNLTMPIPVKYKTINYFKLIDNTKKNNVDAFKAFKKGRIDMTLNLVEDSLEYLSYVDKM